MRRRSVFLILFLILLVCGCKKENKTEWSFSFHSNYLSHECFSFFEDPITSEKGILTFENTNDFPVLVYVYKEFLYDNVENKIRLEPHEKLDYWVDKEHTYYLGLKVIEDIGAFTEIGLSVKADISER